MWLGRTKSRVPIQKALFTKFACSSFKDIHILLSDDGGLDSIFHRTRSIKPSFRQNEAHLLPPEESYTGIIIPGAEEQSIVVYFTSLRVVRSTFEDCKAVRLILRSFRVPIDERDLSMDSRFTDELQKILGLSDKSKLTLPKVFIGGRYIGGVEEVRQLHESGELKKYVGGLPAADFGTCETCGGYRYILCAECSGSHKRYSEKAGFMSCTSCNENGLVECPSCSCAPL